MEKKILERLNNLGSYGVIAIKRVPNFGGLIEITKNIYHDYFVIGWDFNYGMARKGVRCNSAEEVLEFIKTNNINLYSVFYACDPCLTNGL